MAPTSLTWKSVGQVKKKSLDSEQHTYVCDKTEPSSSFHSSFCPFLRCGWLFYQATVFPDVLLICENNICIWPFEIFKRSGWTHQHTIIQLCCIHFGMHLMTVAQDDPEQEGPASSLWFLHLLMLQDCRFDSCLFGSLQLRNRSTKTLSTPSWILFFFFFTFVV